MPRFFFNIRLDDAYLPERTGQCLPDAEAARAAARTIVRALVSQHGGEPRLLNAAMVVTDAEGAEAFELSFFEAIYVPVAAPEPLRALPRAAAIRPPAATNLLRANWARLERRLRGWRALWAESLRALQARPRFSLGFDGGR
ncbi:hypothetical protein J2X36_003194 [Methylobacterium sp. BE186]|uniref:DUF6894 family protein n=1 Tax=Methylobacterium sp. BE186 TaxID=2817715 RepID=UPI0028604382|nr:catalase [Methylobacterium sp. BE186]MDR7038430.1 hypothetical protein [Methylobacterium sp. BE186]